MALLGGHYVPTTVTYHLGCIFIQNVPPKLHFYNKKMSNLTSEEIDEIVQTWSIVEQDVEEAGQLLFLKWKFAQNI